jgi:hypothetical protein
VGKQEGNIPLGRNRSRREDNIKTDLREREWGGMVWTGFIWVSIGTSGGLL